MVSTLGSYPRWCAFDSHDTHQYVVVVTKTLYGNKMYTVKSKTVSKEDLTTLDDAIEYAASLNEFVTITGGELELVGVFGVDSVKDGKCPNGDDYTWKKRRK